MTQPHLAFFGAGIAFKLFFPSVVKWLAYDTNTTVLLSVWYPLICTLGWVHEQRNGEKRHTERRKRRKSKLIKSNSKQHSRKKATKSKTRNTRASLETTSSPTPKEDERDGDGKVEQETTYQLVESSTAFWLRYWRIYSIFQAFSYTCSMLPVSGRSVGPHAFFVLAAEMKLLFFIWIFFMDKFMGKIMGDAFVVEALPLRILDRHLVPNVLDIHAAVSGAVKEETWNSAIQSKARRVFELLVTVQFLSEPFKDWLIHIFDEGRTLILPAVTLLMPGFVTRIGVAYVQFLVPCVGSYHAEGEAAKLLYLQYWTLHCVLSGFLACFASFLWLLPFSTHAIFVAWCYLSFPATISNCYAILETELVTFGVLKGEPVMAIHDTRTVQLLTAITKRLPSAIENEEGGHALREAGSDMTDVSNKYTEVQDLGISSMANDDNNQTKVSGSIAERIKAFDGASAPVRAKKRDKANSTEEEENLVEKSKGQLAGMPANEILSKESKSRRRKVADGTKVRRKKGLAFEEEEAIDLLQAKSVSDKSERRSKKERKTSSALIALNLRKKDDLPLSDENSRHHERRKKKRLSRLEKRNKAKEREIARNEEESLRRQRIEHRRQ